MSDNTKITFHFKKSPDFKTALATGIYGGPTIQGLININFFVDRPPLPKSVSHEIDGERIGAEVEKEVKNGLIREVHSGILLDVNTAKSVVEWLNDKIEILENQINASKNQ